MTTQHSPSTAPDRRSRPPLTRERIIAAALDLIDQQGLADLTMRRLGARLGVEAMSLYKHVSNKDAVVDGVRDLLLDELAELRRVRPPAADWVDALRGVAYAFRDVCRSHPRALPLFAADADRAYAASWGAYEPVLATMVADGITAEQAISALRVVVRHVLADGMLDVVTVTRTAPMTAAEMARLGDERPLVGGLVEAFHAGPAEDLFELGLESLLAGLRQRLEQAAAG